MSIFNKIAELFQGLGKRIKEDKAFARTFYLILVVLLALVIVLVAVSCQRGDGEESTENEISEGESTDGAAAQETDYTVPEIALEENAHADVNELVNQYFAAMATGDSATITALKDVAEQEELIKNEKKSAYIEEFDNIKVYTKPGPLAASYVAFVYYEIKFANINTLAPGLTTLYICSKDDGSLYICDGELADEVTNYIKTIVSQEDVVDLFSMVETKYAEAIDADADLNSFMSTLPARLDEEVSQAMATIQAESEAQTEEPAPEEAAQTEAPVENVTQEQVTATDTVNVRSSDSENADRIGQIAMGETVTRYESKENGWSRINYNGADGYVKSEYLQSAGEAAEAPAEETVQPTETEETTSQEGTTNLTAQGTVTIKETVNVRKSASQTADKLGVAYEGEHYDLIMEQADGWCKISFHGETGFVKTEFVE